MREIWCSTLWGHDALRMRLNGEELKEMKDFEYLGSTISVGIEMEDEVSYRMSVEASRMGCLGCPGRSGYLSATPKLGCWRVIQL